MSNQFCVFWCNIFFSLGFPQQGVKALCQFLPQGLGLEPRMLMLPSGLEPKDWRLARRKTATEAKGIKLIIHWLPERNSKVDCC
jgi:hypothetical protein